MLEHKVVAKSVDNLATLGGIMECESEVLRLNDAVCSLCNLTDSGLLYSVNYT
jgi:hypothetical protein